MPAHLTSNLSAFAAAMVPAVQQAVDQTGQDVAQAARARAPVRKGFIRRNITWDRGSSVVVSKDWKSHFYEFGTSKDPAQPFLVPAAEAARAGFIKAVKDALQ